MPTFAGRLSSARRYVHRVQANDDNYQPIPTPDCFGQLLVAALPGADEPFVLVMRLLLAERCR